MLLSVLISIIISRAALANADSDSMVKNRMNIGSSLCFFISVIVEWQYAVRDISSRSHMNSIRSISDGFEAAMRKMSDNSLRRGSLAVIRGTK